MKKFYAFLAFLCLNFSVAAQENEDTGSILEKRDTGQNELSINAFNIVVFGALDLAYERVINENSSWSTELFLLALNRDNGDDGEPFYKDFSATGRYKHFFSSNYARGFYISGFGMISNGEYDEYDYYYDEEGYILDNDENNYTDFAIGFGLGGKFVSSGGFFLDLSTGIGRNLFNEDSPTIVGHFNVNLGFRF
ncbi:hypothetical protein [Autumnicola musiva]|uniref:DUF3575 domain-containing protein n=1 Tax=Autumnicola musiva TaxID=3075589 RepID=A0ABU3D8M9_9FLAO|nr:hypothetical protein [Zunongwangia sp. F117]MDT0677373.1 hypothetical protein [Zunongwangia sp. F117]